ncbi:LOW QUALITY PROTEIN: centromere protein P [Stigmatopora argus]
MDDENTELMQLEDKIRLLQEEVAELQRTCRRYQPDLHPSQTMRDAMSLACGQMPQGGAQIVLSNLREEVEQLEGDLELQSSTDAISLRRCIIQTLHSDNMKSEQKMRLSGRCSDLDFQVEVQLLQVQNDKRPETTIASLEAVAGDVDLPDFGRFLSGVQERRDLLLFFRTLRTLSDRIGERRRTFLHFQAKYPQLVSLPDGEASSTLVLCHPHLQSCAFFLHWGVDVSREGRAAPRLDLLPKIPRPGEHVERDGGPAGRRALQCLFFFFFFCAALRLGPSQLAGNAGRAFGSLLRLLGPEAALEEVIGAMAAGLTELPR